MNTKTNYYKVVAEQTLQNSTKDWKQWTSFLDTAAQLYKYPFYDQLMIYAQRPDATACAEYGIWNDRMGRYVKKGAKGIALFDEQSDTGAIRYVFDISDTGTRKNSRRPWQWKLESESISAVQRMLGERYGVYQNIFHEQVVWTTEKLSNQYWEQHQDEIGDILDRMDTNDYDLATTKQQFLHAVSVSSAYMMMRRCGMEPEAWFQEEDFSSVLKFEHPTAIMLLGTASSQINLELLTQVSQIVKGLEQEKIRERGSFHESNNQLHNERGLSDSEAFTQQSGREETGSLRENAQGIPETGKTDPVQSDDLNGNLVSASLGNRRDSQSETESNDATLNDGSGDYRTTEGNRSDGMGETDEQLQTPGGRNSDAGDYLQLSIFPSEKQQIERLEKAENRRTFSAFSFQQRDIDQILRHGSNTENGRMQIVNLFAKGKNSSEVISGLSEIYHGGYGMKTETDTISVWYQADGMHLGHGKSALTYDRESILSWEQVTERIQELLEEGIFATRKELAESVGYERFTIAERLLYLIQDFSDDVREKYLPSVPRQERMAFSEHAEVVAGLLANPESTRKILEEYEVFLSDYRINREVLRFHYHKEEQLRKALEDLLLPRKEYTTHVQELPKTESFITEDEIHQALCGGSSVSGGKFRIYKFFQENHVDKESSEFLKEEYGTGGHTHALSGATGSYIDHDAKGIRYQKANCPQVLMTWDKAATLIGQFIRDNDYLTVDEQEKMDAWTESRETEESFLPEDLELSEDVLVEESHNVEKTPEVETEEDVIPEVGTVLEMDGRSFEVEAVFDEDVHLKDLTFEKETGYPISRRESRKTVEEHLSKEPEIKEVTEVVTNYQIQDVHHGEGTPKEKCRNNLEAIVLLKELDTEGRQATKEEQSILANYTGWGGIPEVFDAEKGAWKEEYQQLKELLTPEEYASARASTLNAHYTSPILIKALYQGLTQLGFQTGNVLEPSCGIGNFFGMFPEEMKGSRLYGIELDTISGNIAKQLYPDANIQITGFEKTDRREFYDVVLGNVPFGNYKVSDKPYEKLGFSIHNYFFAKALDQVRSGGIVAFFTSRYTMDSKHLDVRRYLAQRAELLGAIRLPKDAFLKNAGAEVVTDLIFLQKRERILERTPEWIDLDITEEGFTMNSYFVEHPDMVLGIPELVSNPYGEKTLTISPREDVSLESLLDSAVQKIHGEYQPVQAMEPAVVGEELSVEEWIPASPDVKNYSYTIVQDKVYYRENSMMRQIPLGEEETNRMKGLIRLRNDTQELIRYQLENYSEEEISGAQRDLEAAYDGFTKTYGLINDRSNQKAFSEDASYYLLCSLEILDEDGNLKRKADMFTKRTIKPVRQVEHVDTAPEALAISIGEKGTVDLPFMAKLLGREGKEQELPQELKGVLFKDPLQEDDALKGWQTADEYLSGNVREKLKVARIASESNPLYKENVEALEQAQPKDLDASEIDVRLGATWIPAEYIQEFMQETFDTPYYLKRSMEVQYAELTAEWRITGKSSISRNDVPGYVTFGTERANAYKILEETLNLKDIRIYDQLEDVEGKKKRVLNKKETTLAAQKQQAIKDAFQNWVWKDPERREDLVNRYNELFNSMRPREFDGKHIVFGGMNPEISLREHQRNAIAHVLYGGNTLLAHEVGAGKTFEMAAAAMESKRLGLSQKALFVVPNHLTLQWANEFLYLYPSAKLLVANKKDFEKNHRKRFCAKIATGDYDAVIIGHSQFEKIPLSMERQEAHLREQIEDIEEALSELKYQRGESFTIKQMEKTRKTLEVRLEKLLANDKKDDVVTFEELGVDRLFVDESHAFKNLFLYTKMRNVAGLSTSEAQKSSDMFMKCRYMDELTGGRGVIFATGTPVSNSMTELYTVMRYLQYGTLQKMKLTHFDCWASTFGETQTAIELAPEGTGYRARTRFAKFFNLPELMNLFKEVADIKTSDQLHLPVPEAKFETVVVEPSEFQQEMVQALSERAAEVHAGNVDPSEDNMLKITSDGRKLGLDQRLINPLLPDDPGSKLNACIGNILKIWESGKTDRLTQLVFCDLSTPKKDGSFNVYDDVKAKLIAKGIPEEEVAFIHDADTEAKKKELFAKVRSGQVRVLLGSTQKMGAGTNVQDRLAAVHHLDVGWRPSDMTQRNGRIIRQGNQNKEVQIYQYVTEGTFDAYLYQTLENKQKFISQIMTSKSPVRSCDDVDEQVLSYAEVKALCAGNPLIKEKMDLDVEVARLKVLKSDHMSQQYRLEDMLLKYYPAEIEKKKAMIEGYKKDLALLNAHPQVLDGFCGMELQGKRFTDRNEAGEMLVALEKFSGKMKPTEIGAYRGFPMELFYDSFKQQFCVLMKGHLSHQVALGKDPKGNIMRIDNMLNGFSFKLEVAEQNWKELCTQKEAAKAELGKPFPQEQLLMEKSKRLAELDTLLDMDGTEDEELREGEQPSIGQERPSVLTTLKEKMEQVPSLKVGKLREEVL